jgi:hypothetical protein
MIEHRAAVREKLVDQEADLSGVPWKGCAGSEIR